MTYIPCSSFPSCAASSFPFFLPPSLVFFILFFFAFPEDTDDSYSNSPVWGICVENAEREREGKAKKKKNGERQMKREGRARETEAEGRVKR